MSVVIERIDQLCKGIPHGCLEADDVCVGIFCFHIGASWVKFLHEDLQRLLGEGLSCFCCGRHATVSVLAGGAAVGAAVSAVTVVVVDAVDVMTLRLSMTLRLLGLPKDRLTSSKMSSVADGVLLVDESEASTSYELPWIVGVMRLSLLAVLLGGV